jgi:hypothetical protein
MTHDGMGRIKPFVSTKGFFYALILAGLCRNIFSICFRHIQSINKYGNND